MVTSGQLSKLFAKALGLPDSTVGLYLRYLREDGLIETGARGVNAVQLPFIAFSRLLIALLVADKPVNAAAATRDFGNLVLVYGAGQKARLAEANFAKYAPSEGQKFEDVIATFFTELAKVQQEAGLGQKMSWSRVKQYLQDWILFSISVQIEMVGGSITLQDEKLEFCVPALGKLSSAKNQLQKMSVAKRRKSVERIVSADYPLLDRYHRAKITTQRSIHYQEIIAIIAGAVIRGSASQKGPKT